MMTSDMLHEMAKSGATLNVKADPNDLIPVLILINSKGEVEIYGMVGEDKNEILKMLKTTLTQRDAKLYALVVEAWVTEFPHEAAKYNWRVRDMPPDDKSEAVQIIVVEKDKGCLGRSIAKIERVDEKTRRLHEWKTETPDGISGPFVVTHW